MSDTFKEFQTTPTLVFDEAPGMEEKKETTAVPELQPEPMDDSSYPRRSGKWSKISVVRST